MRVQSVCVRGCAIEEEQVGKLTSAQTGNRSLSWSGLLQTALNPTSSYFDVRTSDPWQEQFVVGDTEDDQASDDDDDDDDEEGRGEGTGAVWLAFKGETRHQLTALYSTNKTTLTTTQQTKHKTTVTHT